jgi:hypothetical protein
MLIGFGAQSNASMNLLFQGLTSPAARQLLVYFANTGPPPPHDPLRDQLLAEYNFLGEFPEGPVKLGIANGSGTALPQEFMGIPMDPSCLMLEIATPVSNFPISGNVVVTSGTITSKVWAVPDNLPEDKVFQAILDGTVNTGLTTINIIAPIVVAKTSLTDPYDNAPGGFDDDITFLKDILEPDPILSQPLFDFIPTISSLALYQGPSINLFTNIQNDPNIMQKTPFDIVHWENGGSTLHSSISAEQRDFLLDKLKDVYIQSKSFTKKAVNEACSLLVAGTDVEPISTMPNVPNQITGPVTIESGADVTFISSNEIILKDGFWAKSGCEFHAFIEPHHCTSTCRTASNNNHTAISTQAIPMKSEIISKEVKGVEKTISVRCFPNPFTDHVHIDYSVLKEGSVNISVFNTSGIKVADLVNSNNHSAGNFTATLDALQLPSGIYCISVQINDKREMVKVICQ